MGQGNSVRDPEIARDIAGRGEVRTSSVVSEIWLDCDGVLYS